MAHIEVLTNMDLATEKIFKSTLVKDLQYLCAGLVPFQSNIEIIGHIFMRVDNSKKYNYFLEENIVKTELHGTLLSSRTFSARPDSSDMVISNIFTGLPDEQSITNKTYNTNLSSPDPEGQTKIMPVPEPVSLKMPLSGMVQMPVLGSGQVQLPGIVNVSVPDSVQVPDSGMVQVPGSGMIQVPGSGNVSVPDWAPTVQIQNVKSLAPGSLHSQNNIDSFPVSQINIQLSKSEASTSSHDAIFHGTGNVIQEQNNQVKIPSENTSQSASDILKGVRIKTEPKDDVEYPASPHITVPPVASTSQVGQKKKRKTNHATRMELEPFINKEAETGRKKPRIIKPRPIPKPKPTPVVSDVDEGSQSSSGDFVDVPVHFGELTPESTTEEDEIFPVTMLKNLSGFEEACNQSATPIFKTECHFPSKSIMQTLLTQKNGFTVTKRGRYKSYSQIEKQNAVTSAEIYGVKATCERLNIPAMAILSQNQAMKKAFQDPRKRGTYNFYTEEEKQKAIVLAGQFGVTAICQRFGIPLSTLWTWKKTYEKTQNPQYQIDNVKVEETSDDKFYVKNLNLRQILTGNDTREVTSPLPSTSAKR
ncbi:hypothetical protein LOTGIDRAFT_159626 [Lottia gigantea]|uniref:Uncharacterized protein n=1 Tax=Lottia gigantea TaxID=225164 RepID=V3ZZC1_LOTGI|nr:hypothetical protein LOTGIDRAFT_159626 [Lottia gigantea]ESO96878.1 hypothetical protein LOTGIDRAFT_159626 [Lottia gigantea]